MILRFSAADVATQYRHAIDRIEHRPTFFETQNPAFHKGGSIKLDQHDFPDANNVNTALIPAALWLVKDHGVYLMSNGFPRLCRDPDDPTSRGIVAYALGFHPEQDSDWYQRLGVMGGDDSCTALPANLFADSLHPGKRLIRVKVTTKHIAVL